MALNGQPSTMKQLKPWIWTEKNRKSKALAAPPRCSPARKLSRSTSATWRCKWNIKTWMKSWKLLLLKSTLSLLINSYYRYSSRTSLVKSPIQFTTLSSRMQEIPVFRQFPTPASGKVSKPCLIKAPLLPRLKRASTVPLIKATTIRLIHLRKTRLNFHRICASAAAPSNHNRRSGLSNLV